MKDLLFQSVSKDNIKHIYPLAEKIWFNTYGEILSQEQINYMLPLMYSLEKIKDEISQGYIWEILYHRDNCIGYLDYKLMKDNRVFLSKIYLETSNQARGLGKIMLQRVIQYALHNKALSVYLTVNINNDKAISFYERNNFKRIAAEAVDIGEGYIMDDYIYEYTFQ